MTPALYETSLSSLPLLARGKVRDIYAVDDDKLLIIATDRLSAFDVVLPDPIPGKGRVLTQLTLFWLQRFAGILPNHATTVHPFDVVAADEREQVDGRAMVVKRLRPIMIEAVARGYLSGSGWQEYQENGRVCGIALPAGLQQSGRLDTPVFTPAAKADAGEHDENITFEDMAERIGSELAENIRDTTLELYMHANEYAGERGIIIADTKFEFGLDEAGMLHLMDEVLTPDSSRFWPADAYAPGGQPPSFDKQYLRDWLLTQDWDKTAPGPRLPADVIRHTSEKYIEALKRLTGDRHV
ncbi:MAG TPA: phosphoribosylaminoimidazolesuccinocarboxamide synthase [Burkholderiaceae bacterium]|nr:phosphoribosylaminoimidazolesuccinocarboxamide synthase [Burkholderiaceae bacterium]